METYNGLVRTPTDAIILFEACRLGLLPRVQRRLSEKERQSIRSGSVFVWDEREAGMRRWTDGKSWSASRVSGSFLTYREMEGKRGGSSFVSPANRGTKTPDSGDDPQAEGEEGPDGYRYKPDGLMKQSFSITTSQGQHLHLISYFSRSSPTAQVLRQPSNDPSLSSIQPAKGMYPESTVNEQANVPAVTRSPMPGAPNYVMAPSPNFGRPPPHPHQAYIPPGYIPHPAYMTYPLSPMPTPPPYALHPYPPQAGLPPLGYHPHPYGQPHLQMNQAPSSLYDQRPLRGPESGLSQPPPLLQHQRNAPPAPYTQSQPPPPVTSSYTPSQPPPPILPAYTQSQPPPPITSSYPQSQPPPPVTSAYTPNQPSTQPLFGSSSYSTTSAPPQHDGSADRSAPSLQIDPRLATLSYEGQSKGNLVSPSRPDEVKPESKPTENGVAVTASQVPTIGALVNDAPPAVTAEERPQIGTEPDRQGSASPGGTKNGAPPQDIPSEKLGFREDKRALSILDRAFARV